jgi:hypothetical protein
MIFLAELNQAFEKPGKKKLKLWMILTALILGVINLFLFSWWYSAWVSYFLDTIPWTALTLKILLVLHKGIKNSDRFPKRSKTFGLIGSLLLSIGCVYLIVLRFMFSCISEQ